MLVNNKQVSFCLSSKMYLRSEINCFPVIVYATNSLNSNYSKIFKEAMQHTLLFLLELTHLVCFQGFTTLVKIKRRVLKSLNDITQQLSKTKLDIGTGEIYLFLLFK